MFRRIIRYKRYKDYYTWKCFEVKFSLLFTVVFCIFVLCKLDLYTYFLKYQEDIKQIILGIIGGDFTLLGMSLAGMAIITAMFSTEAIIFINRIDQDETINRVLSQFEFSALNLGIQVMYLFIVYMAIISSKLLISIIPFTICLFFIVYHFSFNIFYIIALIGNCIKINEIKNICSNISILEKNDISIANEVRIDYLLALILKERGIRRSEMLKDLDNIIDRSNIADKEKIKEYLYKYYDQ